MWKFFMFYYRIFSFESCKIMSSPLCQKHVGLSNIINLGLQMHPFYDTFFRLHYSSHCVKIISIHVKIWFFILNPHLSIRICSMRPPTREGISLFCHRSTFVKWESISERALIWVSWFSRWCSFSSFAHSVYLLTHHPISIMHVWWCQINRDTVWFASKESKINGTIQFEPIF
jgi:hypothetical protein